MKNKIYTSIDKDFIAKFEKETTSAKSIAITSHKSPDDDAIGSMLATYYYLTKHLNIPESKIKMYISWKKMDRWDSFKHSDKISFIDDISNYLDDVDLLIILDGSGWRRISNDKKVSEKNCKTICIDHHPKPDDTFDLHLVAEQYTSTAETIYRLFYEDKELDADICEYILIGIMGDTGNFGYIEPHDIEVFDVVKRLVKEGDIHVEKILSQYSNITFESHAVLSELLRNSKINKVKGWPDHIITFIEQSYVTDNKLDQYRISEAIEIYKPYLKSTKGISWGFVVSPISGGSKLSGRSLPGSVSIRDMFEKMGIGGGHDRASGATIMNKDAKEAIKEVVDWLKENKPVYK